MKQNWDKTWRIEADKIAYDARLMKDFLILLNEQYWKGVKNNIAVAKAEKWKDYTKNEQVCLQTTNWCGYLDPQEELAALQVMD